MVVRMIVRCVSAFSVNGSIYRKKNDTPKLRKTFVFYVYVYGCLVSSYVCVPPVFLVLTEARRGRQSPLELELRMDGWEPLC